MLDSPDITPSGKTLRSSYAVNVLSEMQKKNILGQHPSEQKARNTVAGELRKLRKNPLFKIERKKLFEKEKAKQELEKVSIIDPLTGLYHRRFLDGDLNAVPPEKGILERELERMLSDKKDLAVAMLDIDNFKEINDKFGHPIGDQVLKIVAQTILKNIRMDLGDFAIRYGGEEFLIITPNGSKVAQGIIERIRKQVEKIIFSNSDFPNNLTISCGLTNLSENEGDETVKEIAEVMIKRADAALYKSKSDGRNQTTVVVLKTDGVKYTKITPEKKA